MEGSYSVEVDLSNLNSNIGKVIFEDESNRIIIDSITTDDNYYRVQFRSEGEYSLDGARLVSGVKHDYNSDDLFTITLIANLNVIYDGETHECSDMGASGINYKDGDAFSFYVMQIDDYYGGVITLTLSDLVQNTWVKM